MGRERGGEGGGGGAGGGVTYCKAWGSGRMRQQRKVRERECTSSFSERIAKLRLLRDGDRTEGFLIFHFFTPLILPLFVGG